MKPAKLLDAWTRTVKSGPDAPALADASGECVWSRREIDALAGAWYAEHGAALAGRTVVFAEPNGAEWLRVFIGLLKSGAVAAALDPGEPPLSRRSIAGAVRAHFLWEAGTLVALRGRTVGRDRPTPPRKVLLKITSGSTGAPRALAFTDSQMLADGRQIGATMGIGPGDVNFAVIPFGHSYGLGNLVVPLLAGGTAVVCGTAALPHAIAADIARWKPTVFPAVPAILRAMAESDIDPACLRSLRTVISAGAPLAADIARLFRTRFGIAIHGFYGSSETGGATYDRDGGATLEGRSVGRPLEGVRIRFGRGGRFSVASAAVFTIGNRRRAGSHGAHRTADLGAGNALGELSLSGRAGPFVKLSGRRFNLAEVEQTLRRLPGVSDALVVLLPGQPGTLAAAIESSRPAAVLRTALRERLPPWKIPRKLAVLAKFPRSGRGKTDRSKLLALIPPESPRSRP